MRRKLKRKLAKDISIIKSVVCEHFKVKYIDFKSKSRKREFVQAR